MSDVFGALALDPVPSPVREASQGTLIGGFEQPAGDPLLYYMGSYLQTVINSRCGAAYAKLDPRIGSALNGLAVVEVDYVDPSDHSFNARDLPAIFIYRDTFPTERIGEDMWAQKSHIAVSWVPRPDNLQRRQELAPFVNAIAAVINRAVIRGRHPSWIVPGDTEVGVAHFGSSLVGWCGLNRPVVLLESKRQKVKIEGHDGEYTGLKVVLQTEELLTEDLSIRYETPVQMDTDIQQLPLEGDGTSAFTVQLTDLLP